MQMLDKWVEVRYHVYRGGSGSTRMWLSEVPTWLEMQNENGDRTSIEKIEYI